jgi:hypothetical protein
MNSLHKWHQTKSGLLVFGIVELAIAYGFASLAIDSGSLWWYLLTLIFLVGALQNIFKLIGKLFHGRRKTR